MHKKLSLSDKAPAFNDPVFSTLSEILSLKFLFRQGWIQSGISKELCESVADHSFSTAMMAWILAMEHFPELDAAKVMQLAMIHEIGEIYAGDITPRDGISSEIKHDLETDSVVEVLVKLHNGDHFIELWNEFETGDSAEADFVRQIDKLEMAFQAMHYEKETGLDLKKFLECTDRMITNEKLRELFKGFLQCND